MWLSGFNLARCVGGCRLSATVPQTIHKMPISCVNKNLKKKFFSFLFFVLNGDAVR